VGKAGRGINSNRLITVTSNLTKSKTCSVANLVALSPEGQSRIRAYWLKMRLVGLYELLSSREDKKTNAESTSRAFLSIPSIYGEFVCN